jgi:hypothetical protein
MDFRICIIIKEKGRRDLAACVVCVCVDTPYLLVMLITKIVYYFEVFKMRNGPYYCIFLVKMVEKHI